MKTSIPLLLTALSLTASPALSQALPPGLEAATLLPGWTETDGTRVTALHLQLTPGWKTYWRNPGDAGIPASFDWAASTNIGEVTYQWPTPEVIDSGGMRSLGYHGSMVLPIKVKPADPSKPVTLHTTIDFGLCETICVPGHLELTAPAAQNTTDPVIQAALSDVPRMAGMLSSCQVAKNKDGVRVTVTAQAADLSPDVMASVELRQEGVWVSEPDVSRQGDVLTASADMIDASGKPFALTPEQIRVTLIDSATAIEFDGCPSL